MLYRNIVLLRALALTLIFSIATQVFIPATSYALTAGPTAPEFSSFEPADASDMVNIATGDFTYTLPVLEMQSPEGSYPLTLSYHAGIQPEEEASWVGLGWSLNAGSINRYVSMLPDDVSNATDVIHDYWQGGETDTWGAGLGIACVYAGFSVAHDTYRGMGTGSDIAVTVPFTGGKGIGVGIGLYAGSNPYGGGYLGEGISFSTPGEGTNATLFLGHMDVFDGAGGHNDYFTAGVGVSYGKTAKSGMNYGSSLIGASISTANSNGGSFSVLGNSAPSYNSFKSGDVNVQSGGFGITIPIPMYIPIWINVSHSNTRYYLEHVDEAVGHGSLYFKDQLASGTDYSKNLFDVYSMKTPTDSYDTEVSSVNGGAFPAYDSYSVNAQGIGGYIQPYQFEYATLPGGVGRQTTLNAYNYTSSVGFKFVNDFSNSFLWDVEPALNYNEINWDTYLNDNARKVGKNKVSYKQIAGNEVTGFDKTKGVLSSSGAVEWFTNEQLNTNPSLMILADNRPTSFEALGYAMDMTNHIGGFKITNKSGMTYHYSLPVYNFEEEQKFVSENGYERTITKTMPYAYTWLLTAVTGPDFVDRGAIGQVDQTDYGYWVKFDYGKWTDQYGWRTPNSGTENDVESGIKTYSYGKKQLYYLNSVQTRTHTALFVKSLRNDGRGVASKTNGGFVTTKGTDGKVTEGGVPTGTLRLDKILLCQNEQLDAALASNYNLGLLTLKNLYKKYASQDSYTNSQGTNVVVQEWGNILDASDVTSYDLGKGVAQKQIIFNYDAIGLCKKTPNSFAVNASFDNVSTNNLGKLTLNSIEVRGFGDEKIIPPTFFDYKKNDANKNPDYDADKQDIWGNYKSDFTTIVNPDPDLNPNKRTYQVCTESSSNNVDAWSLASITTPLGSQININYESDRYQLSGAVSKGVMSIKRLGRTAGVRDLVKLYLYNTEAINNIKDLAVGKNVIINLQSLFYYPDRNNYMLPYDLEEQTFQITGTGSDSNGDYVVINIANILNSTQFSNSYDRLAFCTATSNGYASDKDFYIGTIEYDIDKTVDYYGGGLRVKNIQLNDGDKISQKSYVYEGGISSYQPVDLNVSYSLFQSDSKFRGQADYYSHEHLGPFIFDVNINFKKKCKNRSYSQLTNIYSLGPFLPAPGVIYKTVKVTDQVISQDKKETYTGEGSLKYTFTTANDLPALNVIRTDQTLFGDNHKKMVTFKDVRNRVGLLTSVQRFKSDGSPLSSNTNSFLHNLANADQVLSNDFKSQGVVEQLFRESKTSGANSLVTFTKISEQPLIQIQQTFTDNLRGISSTSKNVAFDFFSGDVTATLNTDSYGNSYLSQSIPAYTQNSNMGLKTGNSAYKNMLSQTSASTTYKVSLKPGLSEYNVDSYNYLGIVSATANVWTTSSTGICLPTASYVWVGDDAIALRKDGTYPFTNFTAFNGTDVSQAGWQLSSRILAYDQFSHSRLTEDVNGNRSATIMDPTLKFVTAAFNNADQSEVAYSGCEYTGFYKTYPVMDGNVSYDPGKDEVAAVSGDQAHSGSFCLMVGPGNEGFKNTLYAKQGKTYKAGVWVYMSGAAESDDNLQFTKLQIIKNGTTIQTINPSPIYKSGGYYFLSTTFKATGSNDKFEIVCSNDAANARAIYFDDFFVRPVNASVNCFVYDKKSEKLSHILDSDHLYTRYVYNAGGRLTHVYREIYEQKGEYLVNSNKVNFGQLSK